MGVLRACRKASLTTIATIRESCSYEIEPPVVSIIVGREGRRCSSDSFAWGSTVVLCVLIIIAFCLFSTDGANLMVLLCARASPLPPYLLLRLPPGEPKILHVNTR